ncbi:TetR/AcrR family transcriptional regulator [Saccharopolyspora rhizosphaerae]|uniref:TetR/AcrR family transcriptional regulator n=1 Tax=Saccharopolyspora rhizosphaerae TaxID=2492662 RepID=A0A426JHX7_9PSEU|nr:TetR/AcrR family transcriptional regulator [Saccharopolyspora rhizosphaerae]RRO12650.1 TetR/AcrR family transcriptional regulator [Saccharopolyspora rhizosphaerae]
MPRPRTPEGELTPAAKRILVTAGELFYEQGINAIGVEAVAEAAGVTKKTLYDRFGSKDQLIVAYLRDRDQRWRKWWQEHLEQHATTPSEKLLATFDALAEWMRHNHPRGCAFVNAHAELADTDHPARAVITEHKHWVRNHLASLAHEADAPEPERVADELTILLEGVTVVQSLSVIEQAADSAKRLAARALDLETTAD